MSLLVSDAIVLHSFDYLESSRIIRLLTRAEGVQSVLARGARRPNSRLGSAIDLFSQGTAHVSMRPGRDLNTLTGFDVLRVRPDLGALERFTGAEALAEMVLRFGSTGAHEELFDVIEGALDELEIAAPEQATAVALVGAWRMTAALGFGPSLDSCASCHTALDPDAAAPFDHGAGGLLCSGCGKLSRTARRIPPDAAAALRAWLQEGEPAGSAPLKLSPEESRAHQRLLREFLVHHMADERPLRAFEVWEHGRWGAAPSAAAEPAAP